MGKLETKVVTMRINSELYACVKKMATAQRRAIAAQFELLVERGILISQKKVQKENEAENE